MGGRWNRSASPTGRYIVLFSALPLLITTTMRWWGVPFGLPGTAGCPYSPLVVQRLTAAGAAMVILALALLAYGRFGLRAQLGRRGGWALAMVATVVLGLWTHLAPPSAVHQHFFNLRSAATEGAFVIEASEIKSLGAYLPDFDASLSRGVEEMGTARVLGNPPGVTMLAWWVDGVVSGAPWLTRWLIEVHGGEFEAGSPQGRIFAQAMGLAWLFTIAWIGAGMFLYSLARLWLEALAAAVVVLLIFFNPASVTLSPGKDPAQLLTIAAIMWGFFFSQIRSRWEAGALGGMALVVGLAGGLIHAWIVLIVLAAALWWQRRDRAGLGRLGVYCVIPGAAGAGLALCAAWLIWDWNMVGTLFAVARSYMKVAHIPPYIWNLAKPPMFALFAGGGLWVLAAGLFGTRVSDGPARLGRALLWVTVAVMLSCCSKTALETPRLWLAFVPALVLGMALCLPMFRTPSRQATRGLVMLAAMQVVTTCLQWCLFDARESEARLLSGQLFG